MGVVRNADEGVPAVTKEQERSVYCPICKAQPGEPCVQIRIKLKPEESHYVRKYNADKRAEEE